MGFIYTRTHTQNVRCFLYHASSLAKSDFPYKLTNKSIRKKGANSTETFAGHSTYLYRDTYTWHTWLTNIYSYTHMYTHICTSFVCMVCGILFMRCLCKRFRNKCWIFNANIKQKIVFLLPDDLCERFIRVERICILDTFVSRDNNIKVFKGFYGEYLLDRR